MKGRVAVGVWFQLLSFSSDPFTKIVIADTLVTSYLSSMVKLPMDQMSRPEKVIAIEALWQDLSRDDELVDSPAWHAEELAATQDRVTAGEEQFMDWDTAKKELRQRFE